MDEPKTYTGTSWELTLCTPSTPGNARFDITLHNGDEEETFLINGTTLTFVDKSNVPYLPMWLPSPKTGELKMRLVKSAVCTCDSDDRKAKP